ncbi:MAG: thiol:disulfide oxidoreductase [marine bacterium B5-7]|nr:MAG: thiol:disulfide oxidoreductase [marine bacterium B5-7]
MKIYADPISVNSRKVITGLKLMDIDYTLERIDYFQGQHKSPEYLAINPNGCMPSMIDDDFTLWESNAILQYAADKYSKTEYYPTDLKTRADINRWLLWESSSWFPSCYVYLVENMVKPILEGTPDASILAAQDDTFHLLAGILDDRLSKSDWLCGDKPTIADIVIAAPMHLHDLQKLPLDSHPNLTAWMTERLEKLPCWEETYVGPGFTLEKNS